MLRTVKSSEVTFWVRLGQCATTGHHLEVCFCHGEQTVMKPCILKDNMQICISGRIKLEEAWKKKEEMKRKQKEI